MALSVVDSTHINAGKNLGPAFDEQVYAAGLYDNYAGCGGEDPAYIIKTYHATTLSWRNALQGVVDLHNEEDPVEDANFDQCEENYLRQFCVDWGGELLLELDPLNLLRPKKEALTRLIAMMDET